MGTSSPGKGAGGNNPLVPSWIEGGEFSAPNPDGNNEDQDHSDYSEEDEDAMQGNDNEEGSQQDMDFPDNSNNRGGSANRYRQPRIQFNKFVKSGGKNHEAFKNALRSYSRNAAGGTNQMARRMLPAISRVAGFYEVINTIKEEGKQAALTQFNLISYQNKPLSEVLSALSDAIFKDTGKIFEDTQDDNITKYAYSNTVIRICELDGIDLDSLTNQQVEVMTAIFIEETIAQRVINDIGNSLTENDTDIRELVDIENSAYQIVSGMVRNQIMPEIIATQRGNRSNLGTKFENIYRIAFDALAKLNR
jgi:hypothetical protein